MSKVADMFRRQSVLIETPVPSSKTDFLAPW